MTRSEHSTSTPRAVSRRDLILKTGAVAATGMLAASCARRSPEAAGAASGGSGPAILGPRREQEIRQALLDHLESMTIIDAHEHLFPESNRIAREVDVLTLMHSYEAWDLYSAGFVPGGDKAAVGGQTPPGNYMLDDTIPFEQRWAAISPRLDAIRYGDYFRPTAIALRDLYGIERLDDSTAAEASERVRAANKPGLYRWILAEKCRARTALNQCLEPAYALDAVDPVDLLTPVTVSVPVIQTLDAAVLRANGAKVGIEVNGLDDYFEVIRRMLAADRRAGSVALKLWPLPLEPVDAERARREFADVLAGREPEDGSLNLFLAMRDHALKCCAEWDWPVAIHTGVWTDFRALTPHHALDLCIHYPGVRFDIYHLGMPYMGDAIFTAKNYPNAHLNLCWCYVVSETMTRRAVNEIIDLVPVNKVFGFGGDMCLGVESIYGHLVMARECLAEALTERILRGRIDLEGARHILQLWMHDNAAAFYRV